MRKTVALATVRRLSNPIMMISIFDAQSSKLD